MFSSSQEHLEKMRERYEAQVNTMQKGFQKSVEALTKSQKVAAEGYAGIHASMVESSQAVLESGMDALTKMRDCRSPKDLYEVHTHFAQSSVEKLKKHAANVVEHSTHIAKHVWEHAHTEEETVKEEPKAKAS